MRWGQGSLQEIDHVPFVRAAHQARARRPRPRPRSRRSSTRRCGVASSRPPGPAFLDFPLDHVFMEAAVDADGPGLAAGPARACRSPTATRSTARPSCCAGAERPVIMAGTGLYWAPRRARAARALRGAADPRVPQRPRRAAACPPTTRLFFSRARGTGLEGRRRGARGRRADGLPARLRRLVRRGDEDRS